MYLNGAVNKTGTLYYQVVKDYQQCIWVRTSQLSLNFLQSLNTLITNEFVNTVHISPAYHACREKSSSINDRTLPKEIKGRCKWQFWRLPLKGSLLALKRKKAKRSAERNSTAAANLIWMDFDIEILKSQLFNMTSNPPGIIVKYLSEYFILQKQHFCVLSNFYFLQVNVRTSATYQSAVAPSSSFPTFSNTSETTSLRLSGWRTDHSTATSVERDLPQKAVWGPTRARWAERMTRMMRRSRCITELSKMLCCSKPQIQFEWQSNFCLFSCLLYLLLNMENLTRAENSNYR